jgi:GNAT superfamily N-acetyltransferase
MTDEKILHEIVNFLASKEKAAWIYGYHTHFFVRKSYRFIEDETTRLEECFDLSNVNVEVLHQGKGIFSWVLEQLVTEFPGLNIYVESIQNPAVEHICSKHGFVEINSSPECKNMVRRKQKK